MGTLLVSLGTPVQAAEEAGLGGLLQQFFSPATQSTQQVQPAASSAVPLPEPSDVDRRTRRSEPTKLRPKTRYVALQQSEPLKVRITERQTPIDLSRGAAAAFLKDDTLRPGDIVVLPGGARVFAGEPGKQHKMRDFERLDQSRLVDRRTRNLLAAMMVPIGALPAQEARRVMARAKVYRLPEATSAQASAFSLRVVYPGLTAP